MLKISLATLVALIVSACTTGLQVIVAPDNQWDAARYHDYAWLTPAMIDTTDRKETIINVDQLLRANVDQLLHAKGYRLVTYNTADFWVDYRYQQHFDVQKQSIIAPVDTLDNAWAAPDEIDAPFASNDDWAPAYTSVLHIQLLLLDADGNTLWEANAEQMMDEDEPDEKTLQAILQPMTEKMLNVLAKT